MAENFSCIQVGRLFVEGDSEFAKVYEKRINHKYVLEEFDNKKATDVSDKNAFNRATKWAQNNQ